MLLDEEDIAWASSFRWRRVDRGNVRYAARYEKKRTCIYMHRELLSAGRHDLVDHVNLDGLDNRRGNIRICNKQQNSANRGLQRNNSSGYRGVFKQSNANSWRAEIKVSGSRRYLGSFKTPELAAAAYDAVAKEAFGEFVRLNFPNGPDACGASCLDHCFTCKQAMAGALV